MIDGRSRAETNANPTQGTAAAATLSGAHATGTVRPLVEAPMRPAPFDSSWRGDPRRLIRAARRGRLSALRTPNPSRPRETCYKYAPPPWRKAVQEEGRAAMAAADIGLIGLAVMGQNLALNMNDHGFRVAVFNRTVSKVDEFLAGPAKGTAIHRCAQPRGAGRCAPAPAGGGADGEGGRRGRSFHREPGAASRRG